MQKDIMTWYDGTMFQTLSNDIIFDVILPLLLASMPTLRPPSRLNVMSLPVDCLLQVSNHNNASFAVIPHATCAFYCFSPKNVLYQK